MKLALVLALLIAAAAVTVHADEGGSVGNGGQGVYCKKTNSIELFDYYEARVMRNLTFTRTRLTYKEKLEAILKRIERVDRVRAQFFREKMADFQKEVQFVADSTLEPIPDANSLVVPKGCEVVQMAVQRPPRFPGEKYYFVDDSKWKLMNDDQKAGLILHEIIYRESIGLGEKTSEAARYLNSTLASDQFPSMSRADYLKMLSLTRFRRYTVYDSPNETVFLPYIGDNPNRRDRMEDDCRSVVPGSFVADEAAIKALYPAFGAAAIEWEESQERAVDPSQPFLAELFDDQQKPFEALIFADHIEAKTGAGSTGHLCIWKH